MRQDIRLQAPIVQRRLYKDIYIMVEIARIITFGTSNNRDIVKRLMGCSEAFKNMTFATAIEQYRSYERNGLVKHGDGYIVIYHDCD